MITIFASSLKSQNDPNSNATAEIIKLIDDFKLAISTKDSVLFSKLFFDKSTPIIGVMSDSTERNIQQNNPHFQGLSVSNSQRFIREICRSNKDQKENFANTKIQIDDKLATVNFDYAFVLENEIQQWGKECWSLIFAEGQWFITGINFTVRHPSVEKPPKFLHK